MHPRARSKADPIRFGYACQNITLGSRRILNSRTCRLETAYREGLDYLRELALQNIRDIIPILKWNMDNGIYFFRLTSDLFPHAANPLVSRDKGYQPGKWVWPNRKKTTTFGNEGVGLAYSLEFAREELDRVGRFAQKHNIRLTMHPKQMNQLGAIREKVLTDTMSDLLMHGLILEMIDPGMRRLNGCVMILHGGGAYGDKGATLERWKRAFRRLPLFVRRRIVLENDDLIYTPDDLLPVCEELRIPLCLDVFHWALNHQESDTPVPGNGKKGTILGVRDVSVAALRRLIQEQVPRIIRLWRLRRMRMKLHISEQDPKSKHRGSHSQYVEHLPRWMVELSEQEPYDLMVEAKMKDQAAIHLMEIYKA